MSEKLVVCLITTDGMSSEVRRESEKPNKLKKLTDGAIARARKASEKLVNCFITTDGKISEVRRESEKPNKYKKLTDGAIARARKASEKTCCLPHND